MKFSDRNNAIHLLMEGDPGLYLTPSENDTTDFIDREFKHLKPLFKQKIQYVCKPFRDAFLKEGQKVYKVLGEESLKQSGTLIIPFSGLGSLTVFYDIDSKGQAKDSANWILNGSIIAFVIPKDNQHPYLFFCHRFKDGYTASCFAKEAVSKNEKQQEHLQYFIGLILFSNYCEVETKIIPAGKKSLYQNEKYVNETKLPIEILDSTWFTTIIRSEGFIVGGKTGGFFRWQRFGPALSEKKIIWVTPFEKKGYTRRARVLIKRDNSRQGQ
jgi:hypothetical protein